MNVKINIKKIRCRKITAYPIILLFILLISTPLYLYYSKFGANGLSGNTSDWGNFGDYIGGTLTPLFTFLNVFILYKLTMLARDFEKKTLDSQLSHENKKFELNLRLMLYKEFIDILNKSISNIRKYVISKNEREVKELIIQTRYKIDSFSDEISYIIKKEEFNNSINHFDSLLLKLKNNPLSNDILKSLIDSKTDLLRNIQKVFNIYFSNND